MKNIKLVIGVIGLFILVLGALFIFFSFENFLEVSAYEIINKNLWLGIPLVLIGYLIFETIQGRFGNQLLESDYLKNKMMEGQKETKESPPWFIFDYLNGKCPYCKNTFLSTYVSEEHALSDKILKYQNANHYVAIPFQINGFSPRPISLVELFFYQS